MRKAKLLILLAVFAGGCAQSVSAEKFLYLYRRSSSPGHMEEGGYSRYTGRDLQYHYLNVQTSTLDHGAEQVLLYGAYRDQTFRCPLESLPHSFPEGFNQLYQDGKRSESEEDTYRYVREYLGRASSPSPPPASPPLPSPLELAPREPAPGGGPGAR